MSIRKLAAFGTGLLLTGFVSAAGAIDITECGQVIPRNGVGVLQNDLDCELSPGPKRCWQNLELECATDDDCPADDPCYWTEGVYVGDDVGKGRATLQMNGHAIRMGIPASRAIICRASRCTIEGPGEVSEATHGVHVVRSAIITDLEAHSCEVGIKSGYGDKITATNVTVRDNTDAGILAYRLKATNLSALNNGGFGISAFRLKGAGIIANGNQVGVGGFLHPARGLRGRIVGLQAASNSSAGVQADHIKLLDSALSSNGAAETGADLRTSHKPRLRNTTCSRSEVCERVDTTVEPICTSTGETWGVCVP